MAEDLLGDDARFQSLRAEEFFVKCIRPVMILFANWRFLPAVAHLGSAMAEIAAGSRQVCVAGSY